MLAKVELKPTGSQGEQVKEKKKSLATKVQTWKNLSVTKQIMSALRKDKMGILNVFGDGKVTRSGATQAII